MTRMKKPRPAIARLHELLEYNPETGIVKWRVSRIGQVKAGDVVSTLSVYGYLIVGVDQVRMPVHRVAWAMHTGAWPLLEIDHINGIRSDNRIVNLRELEHGLNAQNLHRAQRNNKSGFLGVCLVNGKWKAQITVNKQARHIGLFDTPEKAHEAYLSVKRACHEANTL